MYLLYIVPLYVVYATPVVCCFQATTAGSASGVTTENQFSCTRAYDSNNVLMHTTSPEGRCETSVTAIKTCMSEERIVEVLAGSWEVRRVNYFVKILSKERLEAC